MQRATGLIAAGALSLSLTPGIALAENDKGSEQQPVAEQQANSPAAGEDTAAATDNASAENGTAGEGGSDASNGAATAEAATPQTAPEAAPLATPVAQIGSTTYATLDEAVAAAAEGDVIELLADATTSGLNLSKNLTIDGGNAQPQQASSTENLAQTGDATLPFGLAVTGIALAAGAVALISRRLLKH